MRKVALIGLAPSSHDEAPVGDWECWGLPWDAMFPQYQRGFEMHPRELLFKPEAGRPRDYLQRLQDSHTAIYMQKEWGDIKPSVRYPLERIAPLVRDYFNSSLAYMLAMGIHDEIEQMGVWGFDLSDVEEYGYQRPNAEYLIGFARGMGLKVYIPESSSLCKFNGHIPLGTMQMNYPKRYGYLE